MDEEKFAKRRRSKVEAYYHLVWATRGREMRITPEWERAAYRCIVGEARRLKCLVLAINGLPDHVHLVVRPSVLAKQAKGVSSTLLLSDTRRVIRVRAT